MRLFFITTLALSKTFVVLAQNAEAAIQAPSTCEEQAKQAGLPTDGWEIVYDDDGQQKCRRVAVQEICNGIEYIDADTKTKKCCGDVNGLTWIDRPAKLAKCCAKDHVWTFDNGDGPTRGGCCMVGSHMQDGKCIPDAPPPPPSCPVGTHLIDGQCVPLPQTCGNGHGGVKPSCTCMNYPVCGHGKYLGIKYGHCYILSFSDGQQLGTVRENTLYAKGGFFNDIPFKVCTSTTDCSLGKEVEMGESFYLQDQHGLYTDPKSTKGWVDNAYGGTHLGFTLDANKAGKFMGTPTCAGNECGIQLRGGPVNGGMGFTCPMPTPGITFWGNPKVSEKLRFSEVTCDDFEVPLTSGIDPAVTN